MRLFLVLLALVLLANAQSGYKLVKSDHECNSSDDVVFMKAGSVSVAGCAEVVKAKGGKFFIYGKGILTLAQCRMENTSSASCTEGWDSDSDWDFYEITQNSNSQGSSYTLLKPDSKCDSPDEYVPIVPVNVETCAETVRQKGGSFFIYGKTINSVGRCYWEKTSSGNCSDGFSTDTDYDFYQVKQSPTSASNKYKLLKPDVQCKSADEYVAGALTREKCAEDVGAKGGKYFTFGKKGLKLAQCFWEKTSNGNCPEGFKQDDFDFFEVSQKILSSKPYKLVKTDAECKSADEQLLLGNGLTVEKCAEAVKAKGGKFFIYGKGTKIGNCFIEKTSSAACVEGWEKDDYDFYQIVKIQKQADPVANVAKNNACKLQIPFTVTMTYPNLKNPVWKAMSISNRILTFKSKTTGSIFTYTDGPANGSICGLWKIKSSQCADYTVEITNTEVKHVSGCRSELFPAKIDNNLDSSTTSLFTFAWLILFALMH